MARGDKFANVAGSGLAGAGTGAAIGTAVMPGIGTAIGAGVGGLVGGISGYFKPTEHIDMAREMQQGGLDPAYDRLSRSGFYNSLLGGGVDPALQGVMDSRGYQSLLGGDVDPAYQSVLQAQRDPGFQSMLRGEIDPAYNTNLSRAVGDQFGRLRSQMGGQLANRGLANSSLGARQMADTYSSERNALTGALANNQLQRMSMAHGLLSQNAANMANNRLSRFGLGAQIAGQAAGNRLSRGALGAQMTGAIAANRLNRQRLGSDILAQRSAELAQQGSGAMQAFGNILDYNLLQDQLGLERMRLNQSRSGGNTVYGPPIPTTKPNKPGAPGVTSGYASGAGRSPVSAQTRMNPNTGLGGLGGGRFLGLQRKPQGLTLPSFM